MNSSEQFKFSQTHWRQSIAVKIAAQIIWVIVPIVFVSSSFLFKSIDKDQTQIFSYKISALSHRVSNTILQNADLAIEEKNTIIKKIVTELDFAAIDVLAPNYQLISDIDTTGYTSIVRTLPIVNGNDNFDNSFIIITSYHVPLEQIINQKRKNILAVMLIGLIIFSAFLVFSIRFWLFKPLKKLVDATQSVLNRNTQDTQDIGRKEEIGYLSMAGLDTERQDEFGHLSVFFKHLLNDLIEKQGKLREAADTASKANEAKTTFLANMSHELRTPLNAIIGYSELMLEEAIEREDDIYVSDLKNTSAAGRHLLQLINNILDLSKIEAGKLEIHNSDIYIIDLLNELSSTLDPLFKQRGNKLKIERDAKLTHLHSDNIKIRQILFNLLGNACKFTENGLITLKAELQNTEDGDVVIFQVEDTGIGINPENLDLLFKPFAQEDNSTTRNYSGTGLGLSICKNLCLLLGGNVTVKSTVGEGACFTVTLPLDARVVNNYNNAA